MIDIGLSKLFTWDLIVLTLIWCPGTFLILALLVVLILCWLFIGVFLCLLLFRKHLYLFPGSFTSLLYHNLLITFQFIHFLLLSVLKRIIIMLIIRRFFISFLLLLFCLLQWGLLLHVFLKVFIFYFVVSEIITLILWTGGFVVVMCSATW
jgi:hypothetical protein